MLTKWTIVPWYVTVFLKLVGPFIDPVTKTKMRYNEPLPTHIPKTQLMKDAGGDCDFKYEHDVYWPALAALAEKRRAERKERWEKAGKLIGESEVYLWGGEEDSVGAADGHKEVENKLEEDKGVVKEEATGQEPVTGVVRDMEKLGVGKDEADKTGEEPAKVAA